MTNLPISEISDALPSRIEVVEIPFTYADTNTSWLNWKSSEQRAFGGIGAGAAGCLIGHRSAWERLTQSKFEMALILESDAELTKYGQQNLSTVIEAFDSFHWNILHLGTHVKIGTVFSLKNFLNLSPRIIAKELWERIFLKLTIPKFAGSQFPFSTHAYLIKRDAAVFLLEQEISFIAPIDVVLNSYSQVERNKIFRCRTPLIIQRTDITSQTKRLGR